MLARVSETPPVTALERIADLNVASVLGLLAVARFDFSPYPNVKRWFEASLARPAFARARAK